MGFSHAAVRRDGALELPRRPAGARGRPRRHRLTPADAGRPRFRPDPRAAARLRQLPGADAAPRPRRATTARSVEIDVCGSCDLVWFDGTETARLNGPGLLELIGLMAAAYDLPHQPLSAATRCPRCAGPAEDGAQPVALGPLGAAAVPEARRRLPVVRRVPRGKGAAAADVAPRPGQAAARARPDRLRQLRRGDRQGRRALPVLQLGARACSTSPGWRGRSIRRRCSRRTSCRGRGETAGDAMRRLRRGPAAGRDHELRAMRRDARHPQPARGLRRGREARAGAEGECRAAAGGGGEAPARGDPGRPAAAPRVGGRHGGGGARSAAGTASRSSGRPGSSAGRNWPAPRRSSRRSGCCGGSGAESRGRGR